MRKKIVIFFTFVLLSVDLISAKGPGNVRILILSGSNNHEWQQTTAILENILSDLPLFSYEITLRPDTMNKAYLKGFDVVLSNWNSWPQNDIRWPEETEKALVEFIRDGGGYVTFHASTSSFYNWPGYKKFTTAAWIDETNHGKPGAVTVSFINQEHAVTKGMTGFAVFDELWINAEVNPDFEVLGTATNNLLQNSGKTSQPAIMVAKFGKGRIFHTILGHDARAMRNSGFQSLILRGAEWAATGRVTQPVRQELQAKNYSGNFNWQQTDSTIALVTGNQIVWQYNYGHRYGRPFFHPVFVGQNNMTCINPDDHPWHLGQWFCWKYINGINYWEFEKETSQSAGVTEVKDIAVEKHDDYSATISMSIIYHPRRGKNVMTENRIIHVSEPQSDGRIWMDYEFNFEALAEEVKLERTPVVGQENGVSWGGYAGLSVRFNQDFMDPRFVAPWNNNDSINGRQGNWLYMGFTGTDGNQTGTQIMVPDGSRRDGSAWYSFNDDSLPFYYISPAYLYYKPLVMQKNDKLRLKYRILHLPGNVNRHDLDKMYLDYINQ